MNIKKLFLLLLGLIALMFGTLGIFLPVLPTTPFVLLAAGCFSASSPKLSSILLQNKYFGSYIENYRNKTGIPRKVKRRSIFYLWTGLIISMIITKSFIMIIFLMIIGIGVTFHLIHLKSRE